MTSQPTFCLVETGRCQVDVPPIAIDEIAAGACGDDIQDRRADERGELHDQKRLPELDSALVGVYADAQHQEVAGHWDRYAGFLD